MVKEDKETKWEARDSGGQGRGMSNRETEAIVFVPCTKGEKIHEAIQEVEDDHIKKTNKKRIRVVERGGTKLKDLLCQTDPWANMKCEREDCFPCASKDEKSHGVNCMKENITYTIKCKKCKEKEIVAEYWGESARNGYKRGSEHLTGLRDTMEKAPL